MSGDADRRAERLKRGRDQRQILTRLKLGEVSSHRSFDPVGVLLNSVTGRVPALLPEKYLRMSASSFAFFRGAVAIMAADLGQQAHTDITVQLCGDAHLQNLGSFETPDGRLVFDINDFDETIPGPWEWDVKRMAASIVLAGFESGHRRSGCTSAVEAFAASYCSSIEQFAEQPILTAARHQIHRLARTQAVSAALQQAARAKPLDLLEKYTESGANGRIRFRKLDRILWRPQPARRKEVLNSLHLYRESLAAERLHLFNFFEPVDVAFKVVGTGSVGLRDYVVLMDGNGPKDPLFLQVKQEEASAYAPYLKLPAYGHQGQRVVEGQRKMQPASDLLLGWTRIGDYDFLVRQLNDHKGRIDLRTLRDEGLDSLAVVAGELLARGHARSGDSLEIKGYIGSGDKVLKSIVRYGLDYASVAESDFQAFKRAVDDGRVRVASVG